MKHIYTFAIALLFSLSACDDRTIKELDRMAEEEVFARIDRGYEKGLETVLESSNPFSSGTPVAPKLKSGEISDAEASTPLEKLQAIAKTASDSKKTIDNLNKNISSARKSVNDARRSYRKKVSDTRKTIRASARYIPRSRKQANEMVLANGEGFFRRFREYVNAFQKKHNFTLNNREKNRSR